MKNCLFRTRAATGELRRGTAARDVVRREKAAINKSVVDVCTVREEPVIGA